MNTVTYYENKDIIRTKIYLHLFGATEVTSSVSQRMRCDHPRIYALTLNKSFPAPKAEDPEMTQIHRSGILEKV